MSDALKDFIKNNRERFDDLEPGDLWAEIDKTIKPQSSSFKFKNLSTMFKYGFGASALILGTFLLINSQKEKTQALREDLQPPADSQRLSFKTPKINAGAILLNGMKKEKKEDRQRDLPPGNDNTFSSLSEQIKAEPFLKDSTDEQKETVVITKMKPPYFLVKVPNDDSIPGKDYSLIDTLFNGIKKIEIKVEFCDVNIKAGAGNQVSLRGKISESAGSFIVLGRRAYKKSECKIRFEKQDSILKVWMEQTKVNEKMASRDIKSEASVLNFEVPAQTNVEVNNNSGNIIVSGLENKITSLETSFGNIKADNIHADLVAKSSSGNITLTGITGTIKSDNSFGNQTLENITGNIKLRSSSGNNSIKQLRGNADVTTSFGFQKFEDITGNIISNVSSGNVSIKRLHGNVNARSSFGKQSFENITGDVSSRASSGDITINELKGMLSLGTSFGDITGKNITLVTGGDFKTSSGDIRMNLLNNMEELNFDLKSSSGDLLVEKNNVKNSSSQKLIIGQGSIFVRGISSFGDQSYK